MFNLSSLASSLTEKAKRKAGDLSRFATDFTTEFNEQESNSRELKSNFKTASKTLVEEKDLKEKHISLQEVNLAMEQEIKGLKLKLEKSESLLKGFATKNDCSNELIDNILQEQQEIIKATVIESLDKSLNECFYCHIEADSELTDLSVNDFIPESYLKGTSQKQFNIEIVKNWAKRFVQWRDECDELKNQNKNLLDEILKMKSLIPTFHENEHFAELEKLREERSFLLNELNTKSANLENLSQSTIQLSDKLNLVESTNEHLLAQICECQKILKIELNSKSNTIARLENKILDRSSEMSKNLEEIGQLNEKIDELKKELNDKSKSFSAEIFDQTLSSTLIQSLNIFAKVFDFQNIQADFERPSDSIESFGKKLKIIDSLIKGSLSTYKTQLEKTKKEKEKSDMLLAQITKHQTDARDSLSRENEVKLISDDLRAKLEEQKLQNQNHLNSIASRDRKLKELQRMIGELTENKRSFLEELRVRVSENEELKRTLSSQSQELNSLKQEASKVKSIEIQRDEIKEQIKIKQSEIENLESKLKEANTTIEALNKSFESLHHLNEESQVRNESLARKYDNELKKIRALYETEKIESNNMRAELAQIKEHSQDVNMLKKVLIEKNKHISVLENEKKEVEKELSDFVMKIKSEGVQKEVYVDKRVVTKFLINYFDGNTPYQVKLQILETLSSILDFTEEDRKCIGLQKNNLLYMEAMEKEKKEKWIREEGEKLPDKLLDFLMNDEEDES